MRKISLNEEKFDQKDEIPSPNLFAILGLDLKEEKDQYSQEKIFLLENEKFRQLIDSCRQRTGIDYKYFNKLRIEFKNDPYLRLKKKSFLVLKKLKRNYDKKVDYIRKYVNERLSLKEIDLMRIILGLSKPWEHSLIEYVLTNRMPKPHFSPKVKLYSAPYKADWKLTIEVFGNSDWRDVKRIWKHSIEPKLKFLPDYGIRDGRYDLTLERDAYLCKLADKGYKGKKIIALALKRFPDLKYLEGNNILVRKAIERHRKKRDIRLNK